MTVGVTRDNITIVLQRPRYPENIGAAVRAMRGNLAHWWPFTFPV